MDQIFSFNGWLSSIKSYIAVLAKIEWWIDAKTILEGSIDQPFEEVNYH